MKKPHKSKPRKTAANPARAQGAQPAPLVTHSTRRAPPVSRPDPRRQHPVRRSEPVTIYRRPNPLLIESRDDRQAFRLLLLPFVVMALVIAIIPSLHVFPTLRDLIAQTPQIAAPAVTDIAQLPTSAPASTVVADAQPPATLGEPSVLPLADPAIRLPDVAPASPAIVRLTVLAPAAMVAATGQAPKFDSPRVPDAAALSWLPPPAPTTAALIAETSTAPVIVQPPAIRLAIVTPSVLRSPNVAPEAAERQDTVALLAPPRSPGLLQPVPPTPYETNCPVTYASAAPTDDPPLSSSEGEPFGERLARAAATQLKHFVIYDDKYRQISRAGGDVPALYGVCTDVVVRAYRAMGIDLQTLVQASRLGAGDPNIDHRRTETLRRYLARYGQALAVTPYGEDYQPGDIVTYWRPQNSGSRSHIAIVSAERGPSGRPMIIHNRGWGPQIEDGLFVDRITGHYRYDGGARPPLPPATRHQPGPPVCRRPIRHADYTPHRRGHFRCKAKRPLIAIVAASVNSALSIGMRLQAQTS